MRYSELERLLRKAGCTKSREGANHTMWHSPITGETFPVPRHSSEEVPTGTLQRIKKLAGLN
ncbi:type II toxin-antitoxin system HicA family toxin [Faecalibacterium prausnitzii]|uniref:type II toxin-antitoxin system HicA family toxin n=1 Tax=Faecalibacterium prausnitzii TaxID=853 RepID=UPI000E42AC1C|nr:type II toxin-antitoxin system HicA family toxin [Faecalibacterium prausnitzii]RGC40260.1 type II toxin-antitoxin system HicA family toxin [Faecalibacterium prausnitzii]